MPNKTIYVADSDLPIFERAQTLAGENLSATIVQALRRFVEREEAQAQGYDTITLKVGKQMTYSQKQFTGRELARTRLPDSEARALTLTIFQTAKGRFVLYTHSQPNWSAWTAQWDRDWDREGDNGGEQGRRQGRERAPHFDWSAWSRGSAYDMEVYETLEELKPHVPDDLYAAATRAVSGETVEFLDI